jgi:DNA-directed RNA polymerase subunit beta'
MFALENTMVERLTPIRYRFTGLLMDLTAQYDDQAVMQCEVREVRDEFVNTTIGRLIFNSILPKGMPFINGLMSARVCSSS